MVIPICFDGAGGLYPGNFPLGGQIYELLVAVIITTWTAANPVLNIFQWLHDVNPALQALNFQTMINTNFGLQWSATIDPLNASCVLMERLIPIGYTQNNYTLDYNPIPNPQVNAPASQVATERSSFIISDDVLGVVTTFYFEDAPVIDSWQAITDLVNNYTIYTAITDTASIGVSMPCGRYEPIPVSTSFIQLITKVPELANQQFFILIAQPANEDYTAQVPIERLEARSFFGVACYNACAVQRDWYNDVDTDLKEIHVLVGGLQFSAFRTGTGWTTNNNRLTVSQPVLNIEAVFSFRGLFENNQGIADWAGTSQNIVWQWVFDYNTPLAFQRIYEYTQTIEFQQLDDGSGTPPEAIEAITLEKVGGGLINNTCNHDVIRVRVQLYNTLINNDYKLVGVIDGEPLGVTLQSEQAVEELDTYAGNLVQQSTLKLEIPSELFVAHESVIDVIMSELENIGYCIYAVVYKP